MTRIGGAGGAEQVRILARGGLDVHRDRVENRGRHLAAYEALPDERVQPQLGAIQVRRHLLRRTEDGRWANRFVRLLRRLGFRLVDGRLGRQVVGAEGVGDIIARLGLRHL